MRKRIGLAALLALALAVCGGAAPASASANLYITGQDTFASDSYPTTIAGAAGPFWFETPNGSVFCGEQSYSGEITEESPALTLDGEFGECTADTSEAFYPTLVESNSCHFVLSTDSTSVACDEAGDAIEFRVYLGINYKTLICTVAVGPQGPLEAVELANYAEEIEYNGYLEDVSWTQSGLCESGSGSDGFMRQKAVLLSGV